MTLAGATGAGLLMGADQAEASQQSGNGGSPPWQHWRGDVNANGNALSNLDELTMADNLTGIRDFEGDNLQIDDDGILHATRSKITFHHVDDYGADPTGEEPSDEAFDAAVAAAEDGDWIALTNGTYYLAEQHEIRKELIIYGAGGVIESDCHPETSYFDDNVDGTQQQAIYPLIAFYGERGDRVSLSEDVGEGSDQIPVEDTEPFEVGGGVLLNNISYNSYGPYYPTVSTIREIKDGVLYLDVPARYNYDADGDHNVYPVDFLDNCGFVECHFRNRNEFYWDDDLRKVMGGFRHAMSQHYCRRPLVINCTISGYDTKAWVPVDVLEALVLNIRIERPMNLNGQHAEPLYLRGGTNINIYNPVIREVRRAVDMGGGGGCKDVNVYNPDITGVSLTGISYHNTSSQHVAGNVNVYGGRIEAKPTDPTQDDHGGEPDRRWEYQRGDCFNTTEEDGRLYMKGVTMVSRDRAGLFYGGDTTLEGCEISTVPAGGGTETPVLYMIDGAEDVTIRDCVITENRNGSDQNHAVYIEDGHNIDVDVTIRGNFNTNPINIDGANQIRLQAQLSDARADNPHGWLSLGGDVNDLSLTGAGYDGGHGVVVRGDADATNVTVREFTHSGEGPAVDVAEDASVENLRLDGITAKGPANHINLGEADIEGLWVQNCIVDELQGLSDDVASADNTYIDRNRTGWTSSD